MRWFAIATVGFQLLFLAIVAKWLLLPGHELVSNAFVIPLLVFSLAWLLAMLPKKVWPWLGSLAFIGSIVVLGSTVTAGIDNPTWTGTRPPIGALWLTPIFAFGFLLCPWLDAPFHRVLQESNDRRTFWVVGTAFAIMLLVTASYWTLRPKLLAVAVLCHLLVQCTFTMAANLRELSPVGIVGGKAGVALLFPLAIPLLPWLAARVSSNAWDGVQHTYLRYLALYGVVFPAIVLFYATKKPWPRTHARTTAVIATIAIAAACADMGMIGRHTWLAAVAIAALFITRYAFAPREALSH
jgi:predicted membrane channel-forming protein YqfA (hemolysin III family)